MTEFEVIQEYFLGAMMPDYVSIGPGDDCAVLTVPQGFELCVSTDTLLEGVHFPSKAAPEVVAHRSMAANLSDLAAMGASPLGVTMALTLPDADAEWLTRFSHYSRELAARYSSPVIGGNLAQGQLSITLTVMGAVPKGRAITRSGAQVNDDIYVSGQLGGAAGAVAQLGQQSANQNLLKLYNQPEPQLSLGKALIGFATSAIDLSDGLLADLTHVLKLSQVGACLNSERIPMPDDLVQTFGDESALRLALTGGDDYQLCFTAPQQYRADVDRVALAHDVLVTRIGEVTKMAGTIQDSNGKTMVPEGYQHFTSESGYGEV